MIGFIWFVVAITIVAIVAPFIVKVYFPHQMTWNEIAISVVISIALSVVSVLVIMYGGKSNTEILNGKVTNKAQVKVSCEHSYQVCTGTGDSRVCTTHYEHFNDYDWRVFTTVGELNIDRVNRQGTKEPPRFTRVEIGEHVALENSYIDYLKEQETSLLYKKNRVKNPSFEKRLPRYPRVFDYYRSKPVQFVGVSIDKKVMKEYNSTLTELLKSLGSQKQVNVVVVMVDTEKPSYGEYLRNHWKNGRKNDQVIVLGVTDYPNVSWAYAFGWSKNQEVNSALKYDLMQAGTIDPHSLVRIIESNVRSHFKRRPMEEFKSYLWETPVQWWKLLLVVIIQIIVNVGVAIHMVRN